MPKLSPFPQLPPTPHGHARHLTLSSPGHRPDNLNEQLHFARCRHTAQDPPNSSLRHHHLPVLSHHSRQTTVLANVRAFVLCSILSSLTDGLTAIRCELGPPFGFSSCMNLGRPSCHPPRRRHCANWFCLSSTRSWTKITTYWYSPVSLN